MDKYVIHWKSKLTGKSGNVLYSLNYDIAYGLLYTMRKEDQTCWFCLVPELENSTIYI